MNDYKIKSLSELTQRVGERSEKDSDGIWKIRYHSLHAIFVYFEYAVSCVHIQEENLKLMENGGHNNFDSHEKYTESEIRIYMGAVSAYGHMRVILNFSKKLESKTLPKSKELEKFLQENTLWIEDLINIRDRIASHPDNVEYLVSKRQGRSSDGRVFYQSRREL